MMFKQFLEEEKFKTPETSEVQSTDPKDPESRFSGTRQLVKTYLAQTPGQKINGY